MTQGTNVGSSAVNTAPPAKRPKLYTEEEVQALLAEAVATAGEPLCDTFFCNDPVHGTVQLPSIAKRVIDTKIFQRMRHIKQLSTVYFVYPGAVHCRFMHSIGTAHLAYKFIKMLRLKQPELNITTQDVLCVTLAALCHDLGHPCFSHMFEVFMHELGKMLRIKAEASALGQGAATISSEMEANITRYETWSHEMASVQLLKILFHDLSAPLAEARLNESDLETILELVEPPKKRLEELLESGQLREHWGDVIRGRPVEKAWLYEIVSNWRSGVDVDKFDYFKRDAHFLGITSPFRHDRFMASVKVMCDKGGVPTISPPEKEQDSLRDNFCEIRKFLHSQAYSHKTSVKLSNHMIHILMMLDEQIRITGVGNTTMKMSEAALQVDPVAYMMLTDTFIEAQLLGCDKTLAEARAEYEQRFINRKLMRLVAGWDVPLPGEGFSATAGSLPLPRCDIVITEVLREYARCAKEIQPEFALREVPACELCCQLIKIHGGMGERDPIARIHFHSKHNGAGVLALAEGQAPALRRRLFVFWNPNMDADQTTLQRLTLAFKRWALHRVDEHEENAKMAAPRMTAKRRVLQMRVSAS